MSVVSWYNRTGASPQSLLTTELNSLTTTGSAISSAVNNTTNGDLYMDVELSITYGTNPTAGSLIELYVVRSVDGGSTYEDGSTTGPIVPASGYAGAFVLRAVTTTQVMVIPGVSVPPGYFKVMVYARTTGQTAAASGNTLRALMYGEQVV